MRNGSLSELNNEILVDGPLVSLIVPVYNTAEGPLRRCLRSLLAQDYENVEVLIVDDGSDAETVLILNDVANSDSRVRIVQGDHKGVSHARNLGIESSKGDWIAFCDSDDEALSCFISDALKIALSHGVDFVCGSVDWLYRGDEVNLSGFGREFCVFDEPVEVKEAAEQMLGMAKLVDFAGPNFRGRSPHSKLFRKEALGDLRFPEAIVISEDVLFNYAYISRCRGLAICQSCWHVYYQYRSSAIRTVDLARWKSSIDGVLSFRAKDENPTPFYSRCAFLSAEAIGSFSRACGLRIACEKGKEILLFVAERGCFGSDCFSGFSLSPWFAIYVQLCRKGLYGLASFYWVTKTLTRDRLKNERLIEPSSVTVP